MTNIIADKISSKYFTYSAIHREFVIEASDLPRLLDPVGRIYNDACDAGFIMVSERTGKEVIFTVSPCSTDREGDVTAWHFTAYPEFNKGIIDEPIIATILND